MSYIELIQQLFKVNLFGGMKLGLHNMQTLQQLLGYPDRSFTSIHVAGTNGKGSVSTKIARGFELAGYRVGLYTSPHLSCFRERIRINGEMISEHAVEHLLSSLFQIVETAKIPATFFELTTALAFLYFAQEKVEIAVLETGLGGRLDATNVVTPCLSIITSISLDHMDILGSSCEAIAVEKGGIIKENIPIIIGPRVPFAPIQEIAAQKQSPCLQVACPSPLFEEENCAIAQAALNYLAPRFHLSPDVIVKGLESKQPCRFEILQGAPTIILDVAHNPDGLQHLFQMVAHHFPGKSLRVLFGLSKSKDLQSCLHLIANHGSHFHLVEAPNGRGAPVNDLFIAMQQFVSASHLMIHEDIMASVELAKREALRHEQLLVICGSFFIMAKARKALGYFEPADLIDLNERHATKI